MAPHTVLDRHASSAKGCQKAGWQQALTRAMVPALRKLLRRTLPSRFTRLSTTRRFFSSFVSWFPVMRRPFLFLMPSNT